MAQPVITSFTADKTTAKPGDTVTFTMGYSDPDTRTMTFVGNLQDGEGNQAIPAQITVAIKDVESPTVQSTDATPVVANKISDDGSTAVFKATIPS